MLVGVNNEFLFLCTSSMNASNWPCLLSLFLLRI